MLRPRLRSGTDSFWKKSAVKKAAVFTRKKRLSLLRRLRSRRKRKNSSPARQNHGRDKQDRSGFGQYRSGEEATPGTRADAGRLGWRNHYRSGLGNARNQYRSTSRDDDIAGRSDGTEGIADRETTRHCD